mmetsp:Transcript_22499/g.34607  ORF Transcript_22499/g.34607 Transcript_22499/m.34607 type:complete len:198 (+) Transcript_22499:54-647(+)
MLSRFREAMRVNLIKCSLACALLVCTDAFSSRQKTINSIGASPEELQYRQYRPNHFLRLLAIPTLLITLSVQQVQPASAMTSEGSSYDVLQKITTPYKISDSAAFQLLPREMRKSTAVKQLQDLRDLQDSKLDQCADRGKFWEQCFFMGESEGVDTIEKVIFGKGEEQSGIDSQFISPVGALNPPPETKKSMSIPTW